MLSVRSTCFSCVVTDFSQKTPSNRPTISWSFWSTPWITATARISFLVRESCKLLHYWHVFSKQAATRARCVTLRHAPAPRCTHTRAEELGTRWWVLRNLSPDGTCESRNLCGGLFERPSRATAGSSQVQYGELVQVHLHTHQRQGSLPKNRAGDSHAHT